MYINRKIDITQRNIVILSDITLEPFMKLTLLKYFGGEQKQKEFIFIPYEERMNNNNLHIFEQTELIVVWMSFEHLMYNIMIDSISGKKDNTQLIEDLLEVCKQLFYEIESRSKAKIVWFLLDPMLNKCNYVVGNIITNNSLPERVNMCLYEFLDGKATIIDLTKLIGQIGVDDAYDYKNHYRWNLPYSKKLIEIASKEVFHQYQVYRGKRKKCLVLDCDNVLWGGILSEDGTDKVKLGTMGNGKIFHDFQKHLLTLYYHGVILAICSKNDMQDVKEMFEKHSGMIIKDEHISCYQVNWNCKVENIIEISEKLNIGLDSMVFIDDSIHEIDLVKKSLPEVMTILFEPNSIYEKLLCLNLLPVSDYKNIAARNNTYKTNVKRVDLKNQVQSYDDYLSTLATKVVIKPMVKTEIGRVVELSQRTNRFTNGRRLTEMEMQQIYADNSYVKYIVNITDKFGDMGLVGAIILHNGFLELICLSCRVLGRNIEKNVFDYIKEHHKIESVYFYKTNKNQELEGILKEVFEGE